MGWFSKPAFRAPDYALRNLPGPGTRNAAYVPNMQDPIFSPTGTGIVPTYAWQLTARGDYQLRNLVYAGEVVGYETGAFIPGSPLLAEPIGGNVGYATDTQGAAG